MIEPLTWSNYVVLLEQWITNSVMGLSKDNVMVQADNRGTTIQRGPDGTVVVSVSFVLEPAQKEETPDA